MSQSAKDNHTESMKSFELFEVGKLMQLYEPKKVHIGKSLFHRILRFSLVES